MGCYSTLIQKLSSREFEWKPIKDKNGRNPIQAKFELLYLCNLYVEQQVNHYPVIRKKEKLMEIVI